MDQNTKQEKNAWHITLLLTAIAGYCDTVTFVTADALFSAHVTGNFIVFAYQVIKGTDVHAGVKLLTFPVFILSVIIGGWITNRSNKSYILLLGEGILLTLSGLAACLFSLYNVFPLVWPTYIIALLVVFAMGFQNAFGKLVSKATYGPTTMMTGNVTQASLDLEGIFKAKFKNSELFSSFKKQLVTIGGFLGGCLIGALISSAFGIGVVLIPGLIMIVCYFKSWQWQ